MSTNVDNGALPVIPVKSILHGTEVVQEVSIANLFTKRIDETGTYIYIGLALPGSDESASVWRLSRFTLDNVSGEKWANGNTEFVNSWINRASIPYL